MCLGSVSHSKSPHNSPKALGLPTYCNLNLKRSNAGLRRQRAAQVGVAGRLAMQLIRVSMLYYKSIEITLITVQRASRPTLGQCLLLALRLAAFLRLFRLLRELALRSDEHLPGMRDIPQQQREEHRQRVRDVERRLARRDGREEARRELDEAEYDADLTCGL